MTAKYIADTIESILLNNKDLLEIAFKQRAKFEGWLKFEIAKEFQTSGKDTKVEYPTAKGHVDIFADNCLIELKTPNTSYNHPDLESKTRPITDNVNSIISDVDKLRNITEGLSYDSFIAFVMFPIDTNKKYMGHVNKIENHIQAQKSKITKAQRTVTINSIPALVYVAKV